jgi:hypothetical protein
MGDGAMPLAATVMSRSLGRVRFASGSDPSVHGRAPLPFIWSRDRPNRQRGRGDSGVTITYIESYFQTPSSTSHSCWLTGSTTPAPFRSDHHPTPTRPTAPVATPAVSGPTISSAPGAAATVLSHDGAGHAVTPARPFAL